MFALLRSFFGASAPASALDDIRRMSWNELDYLVREGFRRRGFSQAPAVESRGVDFVLHKHDETLFVQCKRWKSASIGAKPLRELAEAIATGHGAGGFFIATGTLNDEARATAKRANIDVIDGRTLEMLIVDARRPEPFMDPTEGRRRTSFTKLASDPSCPLCGSAMQKKTVLSGSHQGTTFWSCLQHPQCRGKLDADR
jgi:restriction system protein